MAAACADAAWPMPRPPSTTRQPSPPPHAHEAHLAERLVTLLFCCPSASLGHSPLRAGPAQKPAPPLAHFVAYALYRTRLPDAVPYHALYLLTRLKHNFPAARGSCGHSLFISALMMASKALCDDTYSNKSWAIVAQGLFSLQEINHMERELFSFLNYHVTVDPAKLDAFTRAINTPGLDLERYLYLAHVAPRPSGPLVAPVVAPDVSPRTSPRSVRQPLWPMPAVGDASCMHVPEPVRAHSVSSLDQGPPPLTAPRMARAASASAVKPLHIPAPTTQFYACPTPHSVAASPTCPQCEVETAYSVAYTMPCPTTSSATSADAAAAAAAPLALPAYSQNQSRAQAPSTTDMPAPARNPSVATSASDVPRLSCSSAMSSTSGLSSTEMLSPMLSPSAAPPVLAATYAYHAKAPRASEPLRPVEWAP